MGKRKLGFNWKARQQITTVIKESDPEKVHFIAHCIFNTCNFNLTDCFTYYLIIQQALSI